MASFFVDISSPSCGFSFPFCSHVTITLPFQNDNKHTFDFVSNIITKDDSAYDPEKFVPLKTISCPDYQLMAEVVFARSGCYDVKVLKDGKDYLSKVFTILPHLPANVRCKTINGLAVQTLIVNCLGSIDEWPKHFETAKRSGYSVIHLTPIQPLGWSGSAYSIADHCDVATSFFPKTATTKEQRITALRNVLDDCRKRFGLLFIVDAIFPHCATNTVWLKDHIDAGYTPNNSPYLKIAVVVENALRLFTKAVESGKYGDIPVAKLKSEEGLKEINNLCMNDFVNPANLWEFYVLNVENEVVRFNKFLSTNLQNSQVGPLESVGGPLLHELTEVAKGFIIQNPSLFRYNRSVKDELFTLLFSKGVQTASVFRTILNNLNAPFYAEYDDDLSSINKNVYAQALWRFKDPNGERFNKITKTSPWAGLYFTMLRGDVDPEHFKSDETFHNIDFVLNHGWKMDVDVFKDNAGPNSKAYLRREMIVWSDCFKLRYGNEETSNPWLWKHMREYSSFLASLFDGFRLDNCHSVPLHALRSVMRAATKTNSNLIVLSELFAPDQNAVRKFASISGIHALMHEGCKPLDSKALSHLFYDCCGPLNAPIGAPVLPNELGLSANYPITGWVFDFSHDNPPPITSRKPEDVFTLASLLAMANAPLGSTRGVDDLVPYHINVVKERRVYQLVDWEETSDENVPGMMHARCVMNTLHEYLDEEGYTQSYGEHVGAIVSAARHNPVNHKTVNTFVNPAHLCNTTKVHQRITLSGIVNKIRFAGTMFVGNLSEQIKKAEEHKERIIGMKPTMEWIEGVEDFTKPNKFVKITINETKNETFLDLLYFPPGSVLCVETNLSRSAEKAISSCQEELLRFTKEKDQLFREISLTSFTKLLFRCNDEEQCENQRGTYNPGNGGFVYAGLFGFYYTILKVTEHFPLDMGNALLSNVRNGDWALDYILERLNNDKELAKVYNWFTTIFSHLRCVPSFLKPKYFSDIISTFYKNCEEFIVNNLLGKFVSSTTSRFVKQLGLSSIIFVASLPSCPLIASDLIPLSVRNTRKDLLLDLSMSAGLTHFSTGYMRSWGRDTFIALKGILLVTERYHEAKRILLNLLGTTRDHLVPNLIDKGTSSRYNARDATWFLLHALVEYINMKPNGKEILLEDVILVSSPTKEVVKCHQVVQDILEGHANGIHFRERNAGKQIDDRMTDNGFNISISLDQKTGFLLGGNKDNCGTWMDKMGESEKAKNRGVPATPRDGAPIEITALLYKVTNTLALLNKDKAYPYEGVNIKTDAKSTLLLFSDWAKLIKENFFKYYYIPESPSDDTKQVSMKTSLVSRRGIFKDTLFATDEWTEYQLRPNMCVALAFAPELFKDNQKEANTALDMAEEYLLAPLGMRTLDPSDWNYNPNYLSNETDDYKSSCGFNYHNGPEWLWVFGCFLSALCFHRPGAAKSIGKFTVNHAKYINDTPWFSLPELTNENGNKCWGSCEAQAWSVGCILEAFSNAKKVLEEK